MSLNIEIKIVPDRNSLDPRAEFDNASKMVCFHRRYQLGDEHDIKSRMFNSWEEVEDYLIKEEGAVVILPLWLYDHGGISMSVRSFLGRAHHAEWDSGQVGFIYFSRETILHEWGWKRLTAERRAKLEEYLRNEVAVYDAYLRGDTYGFQILIDDELYEDCWGYYSEEEVKAEVKHLMACYFKEGRFDRDMEVDYNE